jgi:hypothetical protein
MLAFHILHKGGFVGGLLLGMVAAQKLIDKSPLLSIAVLLACIIAGCALSLWAGREIARHRQK